MLQYTINTFDYSAEILFIIFGFVHDKNIYHAQTYVSSRNDKNKTVIAYKKLSFGNRNSSETEEIWPFVCVQNITLRHRCIKFKCPNLFYYFIFLLLK